MILNTFKNENFTKAEIIELLSLTDKSDIEALYAAAYAEKLKHTGKKVFFRGLIEFSNICAKDCYYCGIRKSNKNTERYFLKMEEVLEAAKFAYDQGYGSVVLQSGEREDSEFVKFVEKALHEIKKIGNGALGVTLSTGEQTEEVYKRWYDAGAHRYLLRIETTNRELYKKLHPADHSFDRRVGCLMIMKKLGYQVGTGVMIGLPFQTHEDLVHDILFFKDEDVDMIGMGPYVPHGDTPLQKGDSPPQIFKGTVPFSHDPAENFRLGLIMIALTRLALKDVNIAAATALQTLDPSGREKGVLAGANIIMPNITPTSYRKLYRLYDNKPCLDENALQCRSCLEKRIRAAGAEVGYGEWGDSPHRLKRSM